MTMTHRTIRLRAASLACVAIVLCGSLFSVVNTPVASADQANAAAWSYFAMLNGHRADNGVAPLAMQSNLVSVAQNWANHLAADDVLEHNPNHQAQIIAAVGGNWSAVAENAGVGANVAEVDTAFMESPRHRANVLSGSFNYVGIGTATSGTGRLYIVVDFAGTSGPQPVVHPGIPASDATPLVTSAYRDFFGRNPTSSELSYWVAQLTSGSSTVASFITQLATSPAWAGSIITNFYRQTLGRAPDTAGMNYWLGEIRKGRTTANIAANFYASDEYFRRSGATMDDWLEAIYQAVLGRSVDPSGLGYWKAKNRGGLSRGDIAYQIYQSTESLIDRVGIVYHKLLGRAPDSAGLTYWVATLRRTGNDVDLAVSLATSSEYLRRAKSR